MKKIINFLICFFLVISLSANAKITDDIKKQHFNLLDKVCLVVEDEWPILLSDIKKRATQKQNAFALAEQELVRERLLFVYAKTKLKYNIDEIKKSADEHTKKIMADNNLTEQQFRAILNNPPYSTTLEQFKRETTTSILANQIKSTIAHQVSISDEQVKANIKKHTNDLLDKFDIVFISILPNEKIDKNNGQVTWQFKRANEIRSQIKPTSSVDELKKRYEAEKNISVVGPIAYERGVFQKTYDEHIASLSSFGVSAPFKDNGTVTMIWKVKKSVDKLDEATLEKVKKELYEKAVNEKLNFELDAIKSVSTIINNNCGKR